MELYLHLLWAKEMILNETGFTALTTYSGGELRRINLCPEGGIFMVLECPNIMKLQADSTGFFGASLQLPKGRIPRGDHMACRLDTAPSAQCKSRVQAYHPGETACDPGGGQTWRQRGTPGQARRHHSRQEKPPGDGHCARDSSKMRDKTYKANSPYGASCVLNKRENGVQNWKSSLAFDSSQGLACMELTVQAGACDASMATSQRKVPVRV